MEVGEVSQVLPEDLVEKIVAILPFPSIFKARSLSKSWLARFSSISSQDDEDQKCLASFQKQVGKCSTHWETFSPVFLGTEDFLAYNGASQNWGKLPLLSFLPENLLLGSFSRFISRSTQIEGTLLYGFTRSETRADMYELYVANILTRSWKLLPSLPLKISYVICNNLVIDPCTETYKLILICGYSDKMNGYVADIYDSMSETWTSKNFAVSDDFAVGPSSAANLDGVLYMVAVNNPHNVLAINPEEGTSKELRLSCDEVLENISVNVVVCKTNWLLMVTKGLYPETLQVLRIDLNSLRLVQLARGPPADFNVRNIIGQPVGDGNCIFFRVEDSGSQVLAYNVDEDKWSCFPVPIANSAQKTYKWIGSSFHPGLCPFVAV